MCTGAELIPLITTAASTGGNIYASGLGADAQRDAAVQQSALANRMYANDKSADLQSANYLTQFLPTLAEPSQYFGEGGLNKYYDQARANLGQAMGSQVADASSQAGALAGARGLANPSGFVANSANQVRGQFAPQFGNLEAMRSNALIGNQRDLYNAETQKLLSEYLNRFNIVNKFGAPSSGSGSMGGSYLEHNRLGRLLPK